MAGLSAKSFRSLPLGGCSWEGAQTPGFGVPQCLNSCPATSRLQIQQLYLPCRTPRQVVDLTRSKLALERLVKNNHPLSAFLLLCLCLHWSREAHKNATSLSPPPPPKQTSPGVGQKLTFFTTERMKLAIFSTAFTKIKKNLLCCKVREKHRNSFYSCRPEAHLGTLRGF